MMRVTTSRGRVLAAFGDETLLTSEVLERISSHMDSDPRIASVSLVAHPNRDLNGTFLRSTAPSGPITVIGQDLVDLVGRLPSESLALGEFHDWVSAASERGLWHEWLLVAEEDVARAASSIPPSITDMEERGDPTSRQHGAFSNVRWSPRRLSVTVDATWLGPHETGAQVLTTAAIEALCLQESISSITLIGVSDLPSYARQIMKHPKVRLGGSRDDPSDIIWFPNQIDARCDFGRARSLGSRVVVTYLDLIAYDIPRYHSSSETWHAYRALQRAVALSVDGITTISTDVANRLRHEVPRLDPQRVQPILLGLDHIARDVPDVGDDIRDVATAVANRPYVLVLGNDFVHKNRDFAIRVWEEVLNSGVTCDLVLAGLHVRSSSSSDREGSLLSAHTNLRGRFHSVGHVSSESRSWLLKNAAAVLYPTSAEGFGFVPYEAAAVGTPTVFTSFGPLYEVSQLTSIPSHWTVDAYAADLLTLLTDEGMSRRRVMELAAVTEGLTWENFARELASFFSRIRSLPHASPVWPLTEIRATRAAAAPSNAERILGRLRKARDRFFMPSHT